MKQILSIFLALVCSISFGYGQTRTHAIRSSEQLVQSMQRKYEGKWYKTLTFVQNTVNYLPNGTTRAQTWHEAMKCPGKLRINFDSTSSKSGIVFRNDSLYQVVNGRVAGKRAMMHILLLTGFDVYFLPPSETLQKLATEKVDLTKFSENRWQNRPVYVMGATPDDSTSSQVWVDKERLYTVRIIQKMPNNAIQDIHFNSYEKIGEAWIAPEMVVKVNGKVVMTEEYAEVLVNQPLAEDLFDPRKWLQTRIGSQ